MRQDVMGWMGRLVAVVFGIGVLALIAALMSLARRAEGVPPLPIFAGILGMVVLILLAGACLALISIAVSARRGAAALQQMAGMPVAAAVPEPMAVAEGPTGPVAPSGLGPIEARSVRPGGRVLVAER